MNCAKCGKAFHVRAGIPVLLADAPAAQALPRTVLGVDRERFRYTIQFIILTIAVHVWIPAERRRVIRKLGLQRGQRVLDHCTGLGGNLPPLADAVLPGGHIVAVDNSLAMTVQAQRLARRHGIPVDVHQADAMNLPYADGYFDAVVHSGAINQFGDGKKRAVEEMLRVTKPGGGILILDEGMTPELERTRWGRFLLSRNPMFRTSAPTDIVPSNAIPEVGHAMGGLFYELLFHKPTARSEEVSGRRSA